MNGYTQFTESVNQWWTDQYKYMNDWAKSGATPFGVPKVDSEIVEEVIELWEKSVDECLAVQTAWSEQVRNMLDDQEHIPEAIKNSALGAQDINDKWREARAHLWHDWFAFLKSAGNKPAGTLFSHQTREALEQWETSTRQLFDNNMHFFQNWMQADQAPEKPNKPAAKRPSKSAAGSAH